MKKHLILPVLVVLLISNSLMAQNQNFNISTNVGVSTSLLDNAFGVQLGVNPSYSLTNFIALEGQVSVLHASGGGFLTGEEFTETAGLVVVGGRVYFTQPEKTWRPYFNVMIGGVLSSEEGIALGVSTGLYMAKNNGLLIGLAAESTQYVVLKVGYNF